MPHENHSCATLLNITTPAIHPHATSESPPIATNAAGPATAETTGYKAGYEIHIASTAATALPTP